MGIARHSLPPDLAGQSIEQIAARHIGRFRDKTPDWSAFEDAKIEGYCLFPGNAGASEAGNDGLRGRRVVSEAQCSSGLVRSRGSQCGLPI